eukprot:TRINITY_DN3892_c0_g1_i1.p1 TRINITY_DN3892_c0_g1~~TRINITY_DN3892_c0_g1_i1.p1  ORF type:complete len:493 (-),score=75.95 TRINITY_DN3892_c0_g1_i1:581-2059(-)
MYSKLNVCKSFLPDRPNRRANPHPLNNLSVPFPLQKRVHQFLLRTRRTSFPVTPTARRMAEPRAAGPMKSYRAFLKINEFEYKAMDYELLESLGEGGEGEAFSARVCNYGELNTLPHFAVKRRRDLRRIPMDVRDLALIGEKWAASVDGQSNLLNSAMCIQEVDEGIDFLYPELFDRSLGAFRKDFVQLDLDFAVVVLKTMAPPLMSFLTRVGAFFAERKWRWGNPKPENILLSHSCFARNIGLPSMKASDFAHAYPLPDNTISCGTERGTRAFRAPEMLLNNGSFVHPVSEVYSLAMTVLETFGIDLSAFNQANQGEKDRLYYLKQALVESCPILPRLLDVDPYTRITYAEMVKKDPCRKLTDYAIVSRCCAVSFVTVRLGTSQFRAATSSHEYDAAMLINSFRQEVDDLCKRAEQLMKNQNQISSALFKFLLPKTGPHLSRPIRLRSPCLSDHLVPFSLDSECNVRHKAFPAAPPAGSCCSCCAASNLST